MELNIKLQKLLDAYSNFCPCHGLVCRPYREWQWYKVFTTKGKKKGTEFNVAQVPITRVSKKSDLH